jgi:hypothetical protein
VKKIRILLFDLDPQNGSGADLQKLLKAGAAPFEIKYMPITGRELPQAARHLCAILSRFSPQLTCLVFGSTSNHRFGHGQKDGLTAASAFRINWVQDQMNTLGCGW